MNILIALIYEDRLNAMLRKGTRFVVKIDGKPDGERKTFKAAQALARQRGATHFVIRDNGLDIRPQDTRHALMLCNRSFFEDGGRTETTCGKDAEFVCAGAGCQNVRCDRCDDLSFDEICGVTLCEECQPEPERAYCGNCKQVRTLQAYDHQGLGKSEDVKQCAVCGRIVDSERKAPKGQTVCQPCLDGHHGDCAGPARCTCFRADSLHCSVQVKALTRKLQPLPALDAAIPAAEIELPCVLYLAADGCKSLEFSVTSLSQAAQAFIAYRELHNLGASQMSAKCGNIYGADRKTLVAKISYNGRAWSPDGKELLSDSPCLAHFSQQPCAMCSLENDVTCVRCDGPCGEENDCVNCGSHSCDAHVEIRKGKPFCFECAARGKQ